MTTMVDRLLGWTRRTVADAPERPRSWLTRVSIPESEQPFDVVYYQDEDGWYIAEAPELPGCMTQAQSVTELRERIAEAISLCREVRLEEGRPEREDLAQHPRAVVYAQVPLPVCSGREARRALELDGWVFTRQRGSHMVMQKPGHSATLAIPDDRELSKGVLRAVIRTAGLTVDDFIRLLGRRT